MSTKSPSNDIIITNASSGTVEFRHTQPLVRAKNTPPMGCIKPGIVLKGLAAFLVLATGIVWVPMNIRRAWREITGYSKGKGK